MIGTHVDDLLAIGPSEEALDKVERAIEDIRTGQKGAACTDVGNGVKMGKRVRHTNPNSPYRNHVQLAFVNSLDPRKSVAPFKRRVVRAYQSSRRRRVPETNVSSDIGEPTVHLENDSPRNRNTSQPTGASCRQPVHRESTSRAECFGVFKLQ